MNDLGSDQRSPEEAFALLGNDLRLRIIRVLSEANEPLSFSTLRERVEERDSGRFNYHLGKLNGWFVTRSDDGYQLTYAGQQVVGAVIAGTYHGAVSIESIPLDDPCPNCGDAGLEVGIESELVVVACRSCDDWRLQFPFPPGTVAQFEREALPAALSRWLRLTVDRLLAGFCENCGGRLASHYEDVGDDDDDPVLVAYECPHCHYGARLAADQPVIAHRIGATFFADHGYAPETTPVWQLYAAIDERSIDVTDTGAGPAVTVRLRVDDELLTATLDPDVTLESIGRESA
jgi:hypothetical protein